MKIDMNLLKELRDATFAPFKDCKDALVEASGDLDKAQKILKEKWVLKAGTKADRETNEWIVKVLKVDNRIVWVRLLCETDFVAKNDWFNELSDTILNQLLKQDSLFLSKTDAPSNLVDSLDILVKEAVGSIWENMQLWEIVSTEDNGFVYNHPGNKVASIVFFEWEGDDIAKEVALQVAAMNPIYLDFDAVPSNIVDELKKQFEQELANSGKPANIVEQILKWRLDKALAEDVLLEQEYIRDPSKKIKNILPEWFNVLSYLRLAVK